MAEAVDSIAAIYSSCALVVVAAGKGKRFGGPKQLAPLMEKPLIVQTLLGLAGLPFAAKIVVLPEEFFIDGTWEKLTRKHAGIREFKGVPGKDERSQSVREGVRATPATCKYVAIHDGARPLPPLDCMTQCVMMLNEREEFAAVIVASPVTDTLKRVADDGVTIEATEDREHLFRAETPQIARRMMLLEALAHPLNLDARDEAEALERTGHETACVSHTSFNPKVTHKSDLAVVAAYLSAHGETAMQSGGNVSP
ncbi:2-C-methyl-D-erythritol 4-phosphate cytidylyltransferase [soil metagenome]